MKKLNFKDQELTFDAQLYVKSKNYAMQFLAWDGQLRITATTYIPGLTGREVAIKNYGENEGIEQALIDQGFLELPAKRTEQSGMVNINVYNLTMEALRQYEEHPEDVELNEEAEDFPPPYSFDQWRYKVLSPDGITIQHDVPWYNSLPEAFIALDKFIEGFKFQGYYSTKYDRIPIVNLLECCSVTIIFPDDSEDLMDTADVADEYSRFKQLYIIVYNQIKKEFDEATKKFTEEKYHTNHALPATNEAINSKARHERAFYAATDPNDRGCTGHGDISHSDADPDM